MDLALEKLTAALGAVDDIYALGTKQQQLFDTNINLACQGPTAKHRSTASRQRRVKNLLRYIYKELGAVCFVLCTSTLYFTNLAEISAEDERAFLQQLRSLRDSKEWSAPFRNLAAQLVQPLENVLQETSPKGAGHPKRRTLPDDVGTRLLTGSPENADNDVRNETTDVCETAIQSADVHAASIPSDSETLAAPRCSSCGQPVACSFCSGKPAQCLGLVPDALYPKTSHQEPGQVAALDRRCKRPHDGLTAGARHHKAVKFASSTASSDTAAPIIRRQAGTASQTPPLYDSPTSIPSTVPTTGFSSLQASSHPGISAGTGGRDGVPSTAPVGIAYTTQYRTSQPADASPSLPVTSQTPRALGSVATISDGFPSLVGSRTPPVSSSHAASSTSQPPPQPNLGPQDIRIQQVDSHKSKSLSLHGGGKLHFLRRPSIQELPGSLNLNTSNGSHQPASTICLPGIREVMDGDQGALVTHPTFPPVHHSAKVLPRYSASPPDSLASQLVSNPVAATDHTPVPRSIFSSNSSTIFDLDLSNHASLPTEVYGFREASDEAFLKRHPDLHFLFNPQLWFLQSPSFQVFTQFITGSLWWLGSETRSQLRMEVHVPVCLPNDLCIVFHVGNEDRDRLKAEFGDWPRHPPLSETDIRRLFGEYLHKAITNSMFWKSGGVAAAFYRDDEGFFFFLALCSLIVDTTLFNNPIYESGVIL